MAAGPRPRYRTTLASDKICSHYFVCRGNSPGTEPKEVRLQGLIEIISPYTLIFKAAVIK